MTVNLTHACGHLQEHALFGPGQARDDRKTWLTSTDCTDCYRADQTARALEQAQADGLPDLTGTEKQIAWAATIRQELLAEMDGIIAECVAADVSKMSEARARRHTTALRVMKCARRVTAEITPSRWWIDRRIRGGGKGLGDTMKLLRYGDDMVFWPDIVASALGQHIFRKYQEKFVTLEGSAWVLPSAHEARHLVMGRLRVAEMMSGDADRAAMCRRSWARVGRIRMVSRIFELENLTTDEIIEKLGGPIQRAGAAA